MSFEYLIPLKEEPEYLRNSEVEKVEVSCWHCGATVLVPEDSSPIVICKSCWDEGKR